MTPLDSLTLRFDPPSQSMKIIIMINGWLIAERLWPFVPVSYLLDIMAQFDIRPSLNVCIQNVSSLPMYVF